MTQTIVLNSVVEKLFKIASSITKIMWCIIKKIFTILIFHYLYIIFSIKLKFGNKWNILHIWKTLKACSIQIYSNALHHFWCNKHVWFHYTLVSSLEMQLVHDSCKILINENLCSVSEILYFSLPSCSIFFVQKSFLTLLSVDQSQYNIVSILFLSMTYQLYDSPQYHSELN